MVYLGAFSYFIPLVILACILVPLIMFWLIRYRTQWTTWGARHFFGNWLVAFFASLFAFVAIIMVWFMKDWFVSVGQSWEFLIWGLVTIIILFIILWLFLRYRKKIGNKFYWTEHGAKLHWT